MSLGNQQVPIESEQEMAEKSVSVTTWLLLAIPIALILRWVDASPTLIFLISLVAIYPLAEFMGEATESLAVYMGPTIGGLLNATLNNAPEIIIAMFALKKGLGDVVKASITGSILVELLFGLGLAMFLGGLKHGTQRFNQEAIQINAGLLTLCALIPAIFHISSPKAEQELSWEIAGILLIIYAANLGRALFQKSATPIGTIQSKAPKLTVDSEEPSAEWSLNKSIWVLTISTLVLAVMSEVVTDALEPTSEQLGLTPVFSGIILLAGAGGVGEIISATRFARNNNMDLAIEASIGSSIQMILFAVPLLIFSAPLFGEHMDLLFTSFEVISMVLTVVVIHNLTADGRSTWIEGMMLLAVYLMLAVGFFYLPIESTSVI